MEATRPSRECGSCTLCCRLLAIEVLAKPANRACLHCLPGQGCSVYAQRPAICRDYVCGWMLNPGLPEYWRPEMSGMILGRNMDGVPSVVVDPDHPDAWRREPFLSDLRRVAANREASPGLCVAIVCGAEQVLLYAGHEVRLTARGG